MIPVAEPSLTAEDIARANDCLSTGWISSAGKYIEEFEKKWAAYCQMKHGIAVSNGSTAIDVACEVLDLKRGDEVIMPSFTIISCAEPVVSRGAVPVLIDSESVTWQMDVSKIEAKITPQTKAIMVVHMYGHPTDMDPILAICKKYNLRLIEDAAEVHGALYKGRPCGSFGDIVTFSFYANKLITTGEGGMVLTNHDDLAQRARSFKNLCFQPTRRFLHSELGKNYRMTNLQAALGVGQVGRIDQIVDRKREIAHRYQSLLKTIPGITLQGEADWARHVYWIFGLVLDESRYGNDCTVFTKQMLEMGVETRPFFLGMHQQPVFHNLGLFNGESYPVSEMLARSGFYIPSGLTISDEQINEVVRVMHTVLK